MVEKGCSGKENDFHLRFLLLHPVCIWRPISLKVSFMMFAPQIVSSLIVKGKALLSRYTMRVMSVDCVGELLDLFPVSCTMVSGQWGMRCGTITYDTKDFLMLHF